MKIIVCISNERGLSFNRRRQSKDAGLISLICDTLSGKTIRINEYSLPLFQESHHNNIVVDNENFLTGAKPEDYCFVEVENAFLGFANQIDEIIIFKWNRSYPSDVFVPEIPEINPAFKMVETMEFKGSSHVNITLEVWRI